MISARCGIASRHGGIAEIPQSRQPLFRAGEELEHVPANLLRAARRLPEPELRNLSIEAVTRIHRATADGVPARHSRQPAGVGQRAHQQTVLVKRRSVRRENRREMMPARDRQSPFAFHAVARDVSDIRGPQSEVRRVRIVHHLDAFGRIEFPHMRLLGERVPARPALDRRRREILKKCPRQREKIAAVLEFEGFRERERLHALRRAFSDHFRAGAEHAVVAAGRRIIPGFGGIVKVPKPRQPRLGAGQMLRQVLADFLLAAGGVPDANLVHHAAVSSVAGVTCAIARRRRVDGFFTARTRRRQRAIQIKRRRLVAIHHGHMDPVIDGKGNVHDERDEVGRMFDNDDAVGADGESGACVRVAAQFLRSLQRKQNITLAGHPRSRAAAGCRALAAELRAGPQFHRERVADLREFLRHVESALLAGEPQHLLAGAGRHRRHRRRFRQFELDGGGRDAPFHLDGFTSLMEHRTRRQHRAQLIVPLRLRAEIERAPGSGHAIRRRAGGTRGDQFHLDAGCRLAVRRQQASRERRALQRQVHAPVLPGFHGHSLHPRGVIADQSIGLQGPGPRDDMDRIPAARAESRPPFDLPARTNHHGAVALRLRQARDFA